MTDSCDATSEAGWSPTLTTTQMAEFVATGVLRFDALVPDELNERVLDDLPAMRDAKYSAFLGAGSAQAGPATGTPLSACHRGTAIAEVLGLSEVRGIIASLVGPDPRFDHCLTRLDRPGCSAIEVESRAR